MSRPIGLARRHGAVLLLLRGVAKSSQVRDGKTHAGEPRRRVERMARVTEFDPSAFLDDDEVVAAYRTAALEDHNPEVFRAPVGHVAKARGMTSIAERACFGRESLHKALAPARSLATTPS